MKKKCLLAGLLVCGILVAPTPSFAARTYVDNGITCSEGYFPTGDVHNPSPTMNEPPTIHVDGRYLVTDVDPTIINGRTLLPFRAAGEAIGATVDWDQATQTATAIKDGKTVAFTLNSTTYTIDGESYTTDTAPTIINNRTLLPLRAFAEAFDAEVNWDQYLYDVAIETSAENVSTPVIPSGSTLDAEKFIKKYYVPSDPSDPYVGSWKQHIVFYGTPTDTYLFVTKTSTGYHCVNVSIEDQSFLTLNTITVMRDNAQSYYDDATDENVFMVDCDLLPTYYRGGPRGWTVSHYSLYTLLNNNLYFAGTMDYDGNMTSDGDLTPYYKF